MGKRNSANKGKGKVISAVFGAVSHGGKTYMAVTMATSKKGAITTALWACLPGQAGAPAFVLVTSIAGVPGMQSHGLNLAQAQASYNGHPRRVASGQGSPASQFGLVPAPVKAATPSVLAAPAAPSA